MPKPGGQDGNDDGVQLRGVCAQRGGREVLSAIDLSLTEGRIGLVGVNGSGKSTLVRLLNGLLEPSRGEITLFGRRIGEKGFQPAREVGFIFQNPDHQLLFPTVAEELAFGPQQLGLEKRRAEEEARAFLAGHGIEAWAGRAVHELSEGQKQFVCILSVLIMKPRLLILDEPFASLDLPSRRRIMAFLGARKEMQLFISHEIDSLSDFDRIVWLDEGRVAGDGPPGEVLPRYRKAMDEREPAL